MRTVGDSRYVELTGRLRQARRSKGLTQGELASRLSVPQSFVSKYETGERRIDVIEFIDICYALTISPADFLPTQE